MATRKITTHPNTAQPTRRRASEKRPVSIEAGGGELLSLMTEQCKTDGGWSTFYSGNRAQFIAAGVPSELFPATDEPTSFRLAPGPSRWFGGEVNAYLTQAGKDFDMEIQWGERGPYLCAHPALQTIARAMTSRLWDLTRDERYPDMDDVPVARLLSLPETCGALSPDRRIEFSLEFKTILRNQIYATIWNGILNGEILPVETPSAPVKLRAVK